MREDSLAAIDTQWAIRRSPVISLTLPFPALYTTLPAEQKYKSLEAMDRALSLGPCGMRTGNYRPDLFGNNGVHQVGMTEAAEAQFREGRAQRGWELLHGVAAGATVISYCPGTFYEFASWDGQGLLNKHFGNPIGSYIQAAVTGLFGFRRTAPPATQTWHPSIPATWSHARLRLGDTEMEVIGYAVSRTYRMRLDVSQAVSIRLPLYGQRPKSVVDGEGHAIQYTVEDHPAGGFLHVDLAKAAEHTVNLTLQSSPTQIEQKLPFVEKAPSAIVTLSGRCEPLDLTSYLNSDRIKPESFWQYMVWSPGAELTYDLVPYVSQHGLDDYELRVGDFQFTVRPTGQNLVALAFGFLDPMTNQPESDVLQSELTPPIGKAINVLNSRLRRIRAFA